MSYIFILGKAEVRRFGYKLLGGGGGGWHGVYKNGRPLIKNGSDLLPSLFEKCWKIHTYIT